MINKLRRQRTFRLFSFSLLCIFIALIALDLVLSWRYITALIYPGCSSPHQLQGFGKPEEHYLITEDGLTLRSWFYPGINGAAIISMGGLGGSLGDKIPPVAPLIRNGFGVLQIDSRACANPISPVTLGANELNDAAAGLDFLLSRRDVNPDKIALYGFSMGAVTAIRTAARYPQIAAVVAEGGYGNLGCHIVRSELSQSAPIKFFRLTLASVFWLRTGVHPWMISPIDDLTSISPRPILLIYGDSEIDSGAGWDQYKSARQPKELWVVPEGSHGRNHLAHPEWYQQKVVDFFQQTIANPTQP
ncbi:MAG: alpha/beta hydrolase [Anaerolineales bacterium]|jgi:fermentation-respiration switch protein FrsA (DUF1100 family)